MSRLLQSFCSESKSGLSTVKIWQTILHLMSLIITWRTGAEPNHDVNGYFYWNGPLQSFPKFPYRSFHQSLRRGNPPFDQNEDVESASIDTKKEQSRLERTLSKIKLQLVYSMNVTEIVLKKLKRGCMVYCMVGKWCRLQTMSIGTNFEG